MVDAGFCLEEDEELLYDQVRLRRNAVTRLAVQRADLVVAVARADPVGLHAFIRGYQELRDLGVPASRVRVVVNQLRPGMFGGDRTRPSRSGPPSAATSASSRPRWCPTTGTGVDAGLLAGQALREARPGCPSQIALARLAGLFPAQPVEPRRPAAGHARPVAAPPPPRP